VRVCNRQNFINIKSCFKYLTNGRVHISIKILYKKKISVHTDLMIDNDIYNHANIDTEIPLQMLWPKNKQ